MSISNDLPEYLAALPPERRAEFDRLTRSVSAVPVPASAASFVFLPDQVGHPLFDDAAEVFWKAVEQMYVKAALTDGELPLLYWGFHSYDLLARRSSNGVLVTDRSVYVVDIGTSDARMPLADVDPGSIRSTGRSLELGDAAVGLVQAQRLFGETSAADSAAYLRDVMAALRAAIPTGERTDRVDATTDDLVRASRLSADFLLPSRPKDAKKIAKLASKWQIPAAETVRAALSSATLAGIYGLAITDEALYSRDLMEPLDRTPLADITGVEWVAEKKAFRVAEGHLVPTLPAVTDDDRDYFAGLLASLLAARA
jgi:hypothetical protein